MDQGHPADGKKLAQLGTRRALFVDVLHPLCRPYLLAAIVGFIYAFYLLGWSRLNVANLTWLQNAGDETCSFLGWAFLRLASRWYFPPTYTDWLGWPLGRVSRVY